jgi:hypothetical protein
MSKRHFAVIQNLPLQAHSSYVKSKKRTRLCWIALYVQQVWARSRTSSMLVNVR